MKNMLKFEIFYSEIEKKLLNQKKFYLTSLFIKDNDVY